jgi:hypothetical protein
MPVGECRPEIFWYKLMNHGKQIIGALGIPHRIPCGMDTKISEADPESWSEGIPYADMAEGIERDARGRDRRTKYSGGPYPHDHDHTAEVFGQRGHRADKMQEREPIAEKVYMAGRGVLERKHSMVPWIFCIDSRAERAIDHKIRSMAGSTGFRSSEA